LVPFDKCKHFPHMEHPERFNRLVRKFLKGESLADEVRSAAE
jgi:pimeloyl-ACP methyl ester carboxylesterase